MRTNVNPKKYTFSSLLSTEFEPREPTEGREERQKRSTEGVLERTVRARVIQDLSTVSIPRSSSQVDQIIK